MYGSSFSIKVGTKVVIDIIHTVMVSIWKSFFYSVVYDMYVYQPAKIIGQEDEVSLKINASSSSTTTTFLANCCKKISLIIQEFIYNSGYDTRGYKNN